LEAKKGSEISAKKYFGKQKAQTNKLHRKLESLKYQVCQISVLDKFSHQKYFQEVQEKKHFLILFL
jgi:alkyl hydroperoxide reductase subunit AhpC